MLLGAAFTPADCAVFSTGTLNPSATFAPRPPEVPSSPSSPSLSPSRAPPARPDISDYTLHAKELSSRVDVPALLGLPSASTRSADNFASAVRWIRDPAQYKPVDDQLRFHERSAAHAPITRLTSANVRRMEEVGQIRKIPPSEVRGHVRVFGVPEHAKRRVRIIKNPVEINRILDESTTTKVDMASKIDIINLVGDANIHFTAAFDFKSWYDQFILHPEIGRRMCFKKGRQHFALVTAPMGQRQIVEVAHTATEKIADAPGAQCRRLVIIDNCLFAGASADEVAHDARQFIARSAAVGAVINEDTEQLQSLITDRGEWGGVAFNLSARTVALTGKIRDKIEQSWAARHSWTYRNLAAHYGLLFWAIGLTNVSPGDFFAALRYYGHVCRNFSTMESSSDCSDDMIRAYWEQPAVVWGTAWSDLGAWTAAVLRSEPVRVDTSARSAQPAQPDWIVCVDSCRVGWGYIALAPRTGEVRYHGARWTAAFRDANRDKLHRSVFTEPEGTLLSLCHLLTAKDVKQHIVIFTDNTATMYAGRKGFNTRSADINGVLGRLRRLFPSDLFSFEFSHIKGTDNSVADALSRGRIPTTSMLVGATARLRTHTVGGGGSIAPL